MPKTASEATPHPAILGATESARIRHCVAALAEKLGPENEDLNRILAIIKVGQERGEVVGSALFMLLPESLRRAAVL